MKMRGISGRSTLCGMKGVIVVWPVVLFGILGESHSINFLCGPHERSQAFRAIDARKGNCAIWVLKIVIHRNCHLSFWLLFLIV